MIYPPALQSGDTIGIFSPSSAVEHGAIDRALKMLEARGFQTYVHEQTYAREHQSAGTTSQKVDAFHDLCADPQIKAIFAARGGNRAGYMLPHLDYAQIKKTPKPIIGYSDTTPLLNVITRRCGFITYHGPLMMGLSEGVQDERYLDAALQTINGDIMDIEMNGSRSMQNGQATGHLVGGNLSLLISLMGTPYQPDFDGALLFLEDVGDEISRYDRMILQLSNAGIFDKINGLILGDFSNTKDTGRQKFGYTIHDLFKAVTQERDYPVVTHAPFGHGDQLITFPIGAQSNLQVDDNRIKLSLIKH